MVGSCTHSKSQSLRPGSCRRGFESATALVTVDAFCRFRVYRAVDTATWTGLVDFGGGSGYFGLPCTSLFGATSSSLSKVETPASTPCMRPRAVPMGASREVERGLSMARDDRPREHSVEGVDLETIIFADARWTRIRVLRTTVGEHSLQRGSSPSKIAMDLKIPAGYQYSPFDRHNS
ncbi:hypothetical protein LIA77_06143 [Sarocladium implicatum]|nr:hypothetical protein LIA77_06143 [Sarocladium implicatum]